MNSHPESVFDAGPHPQESPDQRPSAPPPATRPVTRPITREMLEEIIAMGRREGSAEQPGPESAGSPVPVPRAAPSPKPGREWLRMWTPSQFIRFNPPRDFMLAGDCHFTRGNVTVLAGRPGVGKSRAALGLAVAGALGVPWLGLPVHSRFRTLILQAENGPMRLKEELSEALPAGVDMDGWLKITPPPPYGLAFLEAGFRLEVQQAIRDFQPGLVIVDPWNRVAEGDRQTDYRQALECLLECLPEDPCQRPAVLILHHLRKKSGDGAARSHGRDLLHELAGSYQIGSAARCVLVLEAASNDVTDPTVVLSCCKNNDGYEGGPTAWIRCNGLFQPAPDFDMQAYLSPDPPRNRPVLEDEVAAALGAMAGDTRSRAVSRLVAAGICEKSKAYALLARHPQVETDEDGRLWWRVEV